MAGGSGGDDEAGVRAAGAASGRDEIVGDGSVDLRGNPAIRRKSGVWKATAFVYVLTFGDSLAVLAVGANLVTYLFGTLHLSVADSVNTVSYFVGVAYILPLFWGFLADAYLGQFWTIVGTGLIALAGNVVLTVSASVSSLQPDKCTPTLSRPVCPRASQYVLNWCYAALYLIAIGSAGMKPCMSSMGQDQFDHTHAAEKAKGSHFFTGFYTIINATVAFSVTVIFYIEDEAGFKWGYGIIAALYLLSLLVFFCGGPIIRHTKPGGSAFSRMAKVMVAAARNHKLTLPSNPDQLYEVPETNTSNNQPIKKLSHTTRLAFLNKAAIKPAGKPESGWDLCTVTQVEELKTIIQILPIWAATIPTYILLSQIYNFTLQQASSLDRSMGPDLTLPAGTVAIFMVASALLFAPVYEFLLVPAARRLTGLPQGLRELQRIGLGLVISILGMLVAAQVEKKRVNTIRNEQVPLLAVLTGGVPMRVYWLVPQFAIVGVVEFLVGVAQLNFFYQEAPDSMKSVATSLYFTAYSIGYFLSTALVDAVNRYTRNSGGWLNMEFYSGGLTNYYHLLAVIMAINLLGYLICAHWYTYKNVDDKTHPNDDLFSDDAPSAVEMLPAATHATANP